MLNFCNKYCTKNSRYNWSYNQKLQVIDKVNIETKRNRFAINL
ncbi:hypothetical protein VCRA2120E57_470015 [Vibrio crassostreae]|nr:hypothetical protein VCRA2120E57_470015 [Vibrio crassostreae]